jgi:nucleoside-diphosphate-sugar epimerase
MAARGLRTVQNPLGSVRNRRKASMKVLVTGGSGKLGQFAITELLAHGYDVINADRRRGPEGGPVARFVETDLSDVGQVAGLLKDCDVVVHLGAIPAPWSHADEVVFTNNTINTYSVFQAAWVAGVQKVAFASSASAYGMAWSVVSRPPLFVPVDESHPFLVADPYGLSKEVDERTAEMFHRRSGMQAIALRFHWVADPAELDWIKAAGGGDPTLHPNNLWAYVDARDAATAIRRSIEVEGLGFDTFNITAVDTLCADPTQVLIDRFFPGIDQRAPLPGHVTCFPVEKAQRLLGWTPAHSWRD